MSETQRSPKRRRRWIVVALSVFVFGLGWWNWPRGDTRFVGKWALSRTSQGRTLHIWQMSGNGGGWGRHVLTGHMTLLNWRVEGNTLKLGYRWHQAGDALFRFRQWLYATTGWHLWIITAEDWEIVDITADSIVLQPVGSPETLTLMRIPE